MKYNFHSSFKNGRGGGANRATFQLPRIDKVIDTYLNKVK